MNRAPGKYYRKGLSLIELFAMFPDEKAAVQWFESVIWRNGRTCPKCGSEHTSEASHKKMPYWCRSCRSYFSVKTGTALANSKVPMQKWAIAVYLCLTSLKSVSSMKLHRGPRGFPADCLVHVASNQRSLECMIQTTASTGLLRWMKPTWAVLKRTNTPTRN